MSDSQGGMGQSLTDKASGDLVGAYSMSVSENSRSTSDDGGVDEAMTRAATTRGLKRVRLEPPVGAVESRLNEPEALLESDALAKRNASLTRLGTQRLQSAARAGNVSIA